MTTWLPAGTPKAMFLVWGDGLGAALTAPALREALAATGALRWSQDLVDLFDLTPAEARLAWSLAQGLSIAEAAEAHGLTVETARYYSKKIYAKTGARGQVDLVRNILTGVLALA